MDGRGETAKGSRPLPFFNAGIFHGFFAMRSTSESQADRGKSSTSARNDSHRKGVLLKALKASPHRAISQLECEVADGVATLSGVVPSYYQKQLAQSIILRLNVVDRIENKVQVRLP